MRPTGVEELEQGDPVEVALENAVRKARAAAAAPDAAPGEAVLGVDTVVTLDGAVFGKPRDAAHAAETLGRLSGRRHTVISGLALLREGREQVVAAHTAVRFRDLDGLVDWYVATGEWRERAGAYAIQERGAALVAGIEGDFLNVVGLPVAALLDLWPGVLDLAR